MKVSQNKKISNNLYTWRNSKEDLNNKLYNIDMDNSQNKKISNNLYMDNSKNKKCVLKNKKIYNNIYG